MGRRNAGWTSNLLARSAAFVLTAGLLASSCVGCVLEFDDAGKNRCNSAADCLNGFTCFSGYCVLGDAPDPSDSLEPQDVGQLDQHAEDQTSQDQTSQDQDQPTLEVSAPDGTSGDTRDQTLEDVESDPSDSSVPGDETGPGDDPDGDGIPDSVDNCPDAANPAQEDFDADGTGDTCQPGNRSGLVITEVHLDPEAGIGESEVTSGQLEWELQWVEIYNSGDSPVDLGGFELVAASGPRIPIPTSANSSVAPGGFFLVSGRPVPSEGAGLLRGYAHGSDTLALSKDGEELRLEHRLDDGPTPLVADVVAIPSAPKGASRSLRWDVDALSEGALANDSPGSWCVAGTALGPIRDAGTPGRVNGECFLVARQACASDMRVLGIDAPAWSFGDLSVAGAEAEQSSFCGASGETPGPEHHYRLELSARTLIRLRLSPTPNAGEPQDTSAPPRTPWEATLSQEESCGGEPLCLTSGADETSVEVELQPGVHHISVDSGPGDRGRYTLRAEAVR